MIKMYLITDPFEGLATIYDSLEECKEEYVERVFDSGSCADVILIANATEIEKLSDFSAETALIRFGYGEDCIYYLDDFSSMDSFKKEIAYQVHICKNEEIGCEVFALTNTKKLKGEVTVTFKLC